MEHQHETKRLHKTKRSHDAPRQRSAKRLALLAFWAIAIVAPAATAIACALQFPAGAEVPLHWNAAGEIDGYGSPWTMALVMAPLSIFCNGLLALCYRFSDFLYDNGFIHGVGSKGGARKWLCAIAATCALTFVGIVIYWFFKASIMLLAL